MKGLSQTLLSLLASGFEGRSSRYQLRTVGFRFRYLDLEASDAVSQYQQPTVLLRDYVFKREWDALEKSELAHLLLAALADMKKPCAFDDLGIVLQAPETAIRDAVGLVRELFLSIDEIGPKALFSLAPLTRAFVDTKKTGLKRYPVVKERVKHFKRTVHTSNKDVLKTINSVRKRLPFGCRRDNRSLRDDDVLADVLRIVRDPGLPLTVTQDPVFKSTKGYVEALQPRPDFSVMREDFNYSLKMEYEPPIEQLLAWFEAEKESDSISEWPLRISDHVLAGRTYSAEDKNAMLSRKATHLYNRGRLRTAEFDERADQDLKQSTELHLKAFKFNADTGSYFVEKSEKYAKNTARNWFDIPFRAREYWAVFDKAAQTFAGCEGYCDPLEEPILENIEKIRRLRLSNSEKSRIRNAIGALLAAIPGDEYWLDRSRRHFLREHLTEFKKSL